MVRHVEYYVLVEVPLMSKITISDIDTYIADCDVSAQPLLQQVRQLIREEAPDAIEKISYGMPTFYLHENLIHFALAKHHIGLYPSPSGVQAVIAQLDGYRWSKGAIQFPLDQPLPEDLIRPSVRFRVHEVSTTYES